MQSAPDALSPLVAVARYYARRIDEYGPTPWGVDWTCAPTQALRFVQLLKITGGHRRFTLNDLGCGYGALLGFVRGRYGRASVDYAGADIAPPMIEQARCLWREDTLARFEVGSSLPRRADFSVASGLFNVQLGFARKTWRDFVRDVLHELDRASVRGFAVNFVLPPRRGIEPLEGLYRTRPKPWIDYCERAFRAQVALIEGYGLREFTLLVRPRSSPARRAASDPALCFRTAP